MGPSASTSAPAWPVNAPPPRPVPANHNAVSDAVVAAAAPRVVKVTADTTSTCGASKGPGWRTYQEGTGWVVSADHIATNAHVVSGATTFAIATPDGRTLTGTVVLFDPSEDVAVLYVPGLALQPLGVDVASPGPGTPLVDIGYPNDGPELRIPVVVDQVGKQQTSDIYGSPVVRALEPVPADINQGNSGGPVLDSNGNVAGIVYAKAKDVPHVGFVLGPEGFAADVAAAAVASTAVSTTSGPSGGCLAE